MDSGGETKLAKLSKLVKTRLLSSAGEPAYDYSRLADSTGALPENKGHVITVGTGRCGMRWLTRFFARHANCHGSAERFADYDGFYRWVSWHELDVDMSGYFELMRRAAFDDLRAADLTIYTGHYLTFSLVKACRELAPTHLIYMIRDPEAVINSLHVKGWYRGDPIRGEKELPLGPQPLLAPPIHRSLGRITPKDEFYDEWAGLTRIGRIAWFYVMMNETIIKQLPDLDNVNVWTIKLSDLDQNYDYYRTMATEFGLEPQLSRTDFMAVKESVENRGKSRRSASDWSAAEKRDFEKIVGPFRQVYDGLKTTGL
jgi:hypothetical protein